MYDVFMLDIRYRLYPKFNDGSTYTLKIMSQPVDTGRKPPII